MDEGTPWWVWGIVGVFGVIIAVCCYQFMKALPEAAQEAGTALEKAAKAVEKRWRDRQEIKKLEREIRKKRLERELKTLEDE